MQPDLANLLQTSWQEEMAQMITRLDELLTFVEIDAGHIESMTDATPDFPLRVPRPYARRIKPGDINDPLLRQILPLQQEHDTPTGFVSDPLQETQTNRQPGIIHKYHGRVLLVLAPSCAINCRYCFRREFPYQENNLSLQDWDNALDYVRRDASISEVIFSGGDPLVNNDARLRALVERVADIPHVERLRIHTRLPVVLPQRVTDDLIASITSPRLQTVMVLHSNHANEIDQSVAQATRELQRAGITLLNQAVLLRDVNDNLAAQIDLNQALFRAQVMPYYLHLLDPVRGAAHFDVPEAEARILLQQMLAHLPGYLVPKLVRETPQKPAKTPIPIGL